MLSSAYAQSRVKTDHAESFLMAETVGIAPGGATTLALGQSLEPGWHVYWRNPGDSGLPLDLAWKLPEGASASGVQYPAPSRISVGPLVNFGFEGEPTFLIDITAPPHAPVGSILEIELRATWLICADICVPETGVFSLSMPVVEAPAADAMRAAFFAEVRAAMPSPYAGTAYFSVSGDQLKLVLNDDPLAQAVYFFPAMAGLSEPAAEQKLSRAGSQMILTVKGGAALKDAGANLEGVVAVERSNGTANYLLVADRRTSSARVVEKSATTEQSRELGGLLSYIVAALIGGALLNLMPCVFPILFVKAASMASAANTSPAAMRRHGLLYLAGVVATFSALGGLLIMLRAGGAGLGWGFHLQMPVVVALSAYVLFLVGLNLAGAFHIGSSAQDVGGGLLARADGEAGAFLTGALAVFVAAPCVGPFLTAPIGAAAMLPAVAAMSIFVSMAVGFALPYVVISFWPGVRRLLPKPGRWMEIFRQALSLPVFGAAGFFVWVMAAQTGAEGLAIILAGLILLALATRLWEWGKGKAWGVAAAALILLGALVPLTALESTASNVEAAPAVRFDAADVERRHAEGEAIFVEFTAAWCVTCQVNKATVLSSRETKAAFAAAGVTLVVADWTNKDPKIAKALAAFGANGVPLYVAYAPGRDPAVLPLPLTAATIRAAFAGVGRATP